MVNHMKAEFWQPSELNCHVALHLNIVGHFLAMQTTKMRRVAKSSLIHEDMSKLGGRSRLKRF